MLKGGNSNRLLGAEDLSVLAGTYSVCPWYASFDLFGSLRLQVCFSGQSFEMADRNVGDSPFLLYPLVDDEPKESD